MAMITAVVPAAGCGARAALNGNKILAPLHGKPLLFWTLRALENHAEQIVVSARREEFGLIREAAGEIAVEIVEGGASRQDSVWAGVRAARGEWVLVHDAARPCVSREIIEECIEAAQNYGAAIAAQNASDTIKRVNSHGEIVETLDRREIWLAQTPQVFARETFLKALNHAAQTGFSGTDCASIWENFGEKVRVVNGDSSNLKVTFAPDLERAAAILEGRFEEKNA